MNRTKRFIDDESGMTMALAVIMIALLGVLGAGLLVFATSDLNTVVESNQGQRAFETADAGIEAAKRQLVSVDDPTSYGEEGDSPWAAVNDGIELDGLYEASTANTATVTIDSTDQPEGSFRVLSTGTYGDAKRVIEAILSPTEGINLTRSYYTEESIYCNSNSDFRWSTADFIAKGDAEFSSNCKINMDSGNIFVGGTADFQSNTSLSNGSIYVDGSANFNSNTTVGGGEGIFVRDNATFDSNTNVGGASRIYVGGDAVFKGNSKVNTSSIYTGGNATFNNNSALNATSLFSDRNVILNGNNFSLGNQPDNLYKKWAETNDDYTYPNSFNPTPRSSHLSGIGAAGTISGNGKSKASVGSRSYDNSTNPRFTVSSATSPTDMTFPFDPAEYSAPLDEMAQSVESSQLSEEDIDALEQIAREQESATGNNHYREVGNGTQSIVENADGGDASENNWPIESSNQYGYGTVVFYKFLNPDENNIVEWEINRSCDDTTMKGIIVVENGNFLVDSNKKGFNGWIVVRDGTFTAKSNTCMNAFINATDVITTESNTKINEVSLDAEEDLSEFRTTNVRNWRECYSEICSSSTP